MVKPASCCPSRHPRDGRGESLSPGGGGELRTDRPHKPTGFLPRVCPRNPTRFFAGGGMWAPPPKLSAAAPKPRTGSSACVGRFLPRFLGCPLQGRSQSLRPRLSETTWFRSTYAWPKMEIRGWGRRRAAVFWKTP
jgi:hypothetical protein